MSGNRLSWTYFEGEWREGNTRILGPESHGGWLGSMVFDGCRSFEGIAPDLPRHAERINASARAMGLEPTLQPDEIIQLTREGLGKFPADMAVFIRPLYWAEDGDAGMIVPDAASTTFALSLEAMPMTEPAGFSITTTRFRRPTLETAVSNAKAACLYPNSARMIREARSRGFNNALAQDANGNAAEFASSNAFMVKGGEVFTPIANGTFLAGITRKRVIGLLRDAGIPTHETTLTIEDFRGADEIFSTGNFAKVIPVTRFDDKELAYGPIAKKARALYWEWAHSQG
jgi:branched-chain amino acid aminotransferase